MEIKFKRLSTAAQAPVRGSSDAACFDMFSNGLIETDFYLEYGTGIALEIPSGYVGMMFARSSVTNMSLMLKNSVGIIDSDYRGEIKFRFYKLPGLGEIYKRGDKIGQIMFVKLPEVELIESDSLSDTQRGEGGFGSTGGYTLRS
jgi:dUTP pyrophosphatase